MDYYRLFMGMMRKMAAITQKSSWNQGYLNI